MTYGQRTTKSGIPVRKTASSQASAPDWLNISGSTPRWSASGLLILILFGGLSLWIYIILWLIVPKAPKAINRIKHHG